MADLRDVIAQERRNVLGLMRLAELILVRDPPDLAPELALLDAMAERARVLATIIQVRVFAAATAKILGTEILGAA